MTTETLTAPSSEVRAMSINGTPIEIPAGTAVSIEVKRERLLRRDVLGLALPLLVFASGYDVRAQLALESIGRNLRGADLHLSRAAVALGISYEEAAARHAAGDREVIDRRTASKIWHFGEGVGVPFPPKFAMSYVSLEHAEQLAGAYREKHGRAPSPSALSDLLFPAAHPLETFDPTIPGNHEPRT